MDSLAHCHLSSICLGVSTGGTLWPLVWLVGCHLHPAACWGVTFIQLHETLGTSEDKPSHCTPKPRSRTHEAECVAHVLLRWEMAVRRAHHCSSDPGDHSLRLACAPRKCCRPVRSLHALKEQIWIPRWQGELRPQLYDQRGTGSSGAGSGKSESPPGPLRWSRT